TAAGPALCGLDRRQPRGVVPGGQAGGPGVLGGRAVGIVAVRFRPGVAARAYRPRRARDPRPGRWAAGRRASGRAARLRDRPPADPGYRGHPAVRRAAPGAVRRADRRAPGHRTRRPRRRRRPPLRITQHDQRRDFVMTAAPSTQPVTPSDDPAVVGSEIIRLNPFDGLFLRASHLDRMEQYAADLVAAVGMAGGAGVVEGMGVTLDG